MNTNNNDNMMDEILKDAYREIEPADSWDSLRTRIDQRISRKESVSGIANNVVFWRRLAFGMAACFLLTAGILFYFLGFNSGMKIHQQKQLAGTNNLLNTAELEHLRVAFSQVDQLFGQQSQWIMVGSGNSTQLGVGDKLASQSSVGEVIVVRLGVNLDNQSGQPQYFDLVSFSGQQANFQLPIAGTSAIDISLRPILRNDGTVEVEINAKTNDNSQAKSISTVVDNHFTSLVRMRANGNWVDIDGIARPIINRGHKL